MRISDWSSDVCSSDLLAELAGAAGLLLVPVVALGLRGHGFAVGDARRARGDIDAMALLQPVEVHAQVQVGQAADHGLVGVGQVLDLETGILLGRSEEHTSELQSLMRISYAVFCLKKKTNPIVNFNIKTNLSRYAQS